MGHVFVYGVLGRCCMWVTCVFWRFGLENVADGGASRRSVRDAWGAAWREPCASRLAILIRSLICRLLAHSSHACLQLTVSVLCLTRCTVAARPLLRLVARIRVWLCRVCGGGGCGVDVGGGGGGFVVRSQARVSASGALHACT